LRIIGRRIN